MSHRPVLAFFSSLFILAVLPLACASQVQDVPSQGAGPGGQSPDSQDGAPLTPDGAAGGNDAASRDATLDGSPHLDGGTQDGALVDDAAADGAPADATADVAPSDAAACDGGVFDLQSDPSHCGSCDNACPPPDVNTVATCTSGTCGTKCAQGWAPCGDGSTACVFDVSHDSQNCGACGHVCGSGNTTGAQCTNGACVFNCIAGTAHCGNNDLVGCETTITTDPSNCGYCEFSCGSAICTAGVCAYSTAEQILGVGSETALAADSASLYWANDDSWAPTAQHVIRSVKKDGTGLRTVYPGTANGGPNSASGTSLALDQHYAYYFGDTYATLPYRQTKSGALAPTVLDISPTNYVATGVITDGDDTHDATYLYYTQAANNPGLWRVPIATPSARTRIFFSGEARGLARSGVNVFFGNTVNNSVMYFDITQANPQIKSLTAFPAPTHGLASDGTNVYVLCQDGGLYSVPLATGNATLLASQGLTDGIVATDGINVYVGGYDLYRVPVSASGAPLSQHKIVDHTTLPGAPSLISGFAIDASGVYFSNYAGVYKTR